MGTTPANDFHTRMQRLEALIEQAERLTDPEARAHMQEILRAVLDLHATGLERLLDHVADAGETGRRIIDGLGRDPLVGSLLLLHGLHPVDLETRVRGAVDKVRTGLRAHGGGVELLGVADGVVRLRVEPGGHTCPSSADTVRQMIERAVYDAAPDAAGLEVEGLTPPAADGLVQLGVLSRPGGNGRPAANQTVGSNF